MRSRRSSDSACAAAPFRHTPRVVSFLLVALLHITSTTTTVATTPVTASVLSKLGLHRQQQLQKVQQQLFRDTTKRHLITTTTRSSTATSRSTTATSSSRSSSSSTRGQQRRVLLHDEDEASGYNNNNTVQISISVALPLNWNLSDTAMDQHLDQHQQGVQEEQQFVDTVSLAASNLFDATLDHAITMLENAPTNYTTIVPPQKDHDGDGTATSNTTATTSSTSTTTSSSSTTTSSSSTSSILKDETTTATTESSHQALLPYTSNSTATTIGNGYYSYSTAPMIDNTTLSPTSTAPTSSPTTTTTTTTTTTSNSSLEYLDQDTLNEMMALVAGSVLTANNHNNTTNSNSNNDHDDDLQQAQDVLWEWLETTPLTKQVLYEMVLDYLDVAPPPAEEEASRTTTTTTTTSSSSSSSSLLQDLKAEIRRQIYAFFFPAPAPAPEQSSAQHLGKDATTNNNNYEQYPMRDSSKNTTNNNNNTDYYNYYDDDDDGDNGSIHQISIITSSAIASESQFDAFQQQEQQDFTTPGTSSSTSSWDSSITETYYTSGLWEMYLAGTRVELVTASISQDVDNSKNNYAWWKITMIYPVYVHYQVIHVVGVNHDNITDTNINTGNEISSSTSAAATATDTNANTNNNNDNTTSAKTIVEAYYVPVEDQGTLDFIGRLLQRVLEASVVSGAFWLTLNELAYQDSTSAINQGETASTTTATFASSMDQSELVWEILGLAMPGDEYDLPDHGSLSMDEPLNIGDLMDEPPIPPDGVSVTGTGLRDETKEAGTYTHSIFHCNDSSTSTSSSGGFYNDNHWDFRQALGVGLLVATLGGVGTIVVLSSLRYSVDKGVQEEAWQLGTDQAVRELLRVGWLQYHVPDTKDLSLGPHQFIVKRQDTPDTDEENGYRHSHSSTEKTTTTTTPTMEPPKVAEIIQLYDKSRAGYRDNDSMLHGSAMERPESCVYDSDAEKIEVPANGGGYKQKPLNTSLLEKIDAANV